MRNKILFDHDSENGRFTIIQEPNKDYRTVLLSMVTIAYFDTDLKNSILFLKIIVEYEDKINTEDLLCKMIGDALGVKFENIAYLNV